MKAYSRADLIRAIVGQQWAVAMPPWSPWIPVNPEHDRIVDDLVRDHT